MVTLWEVKMISRRFCAPNEGGYKMEAVVFEIGKDTGRVRFTAAVFAIGFFLGMIAKCVVGGSYIALALYALGFVLSYTAVVFTVPEKEHAYEGR